MQDRIATTLLTGFLGSGKTTLLNTLLRDPLFAETAVIVNEFGEIGIDHLLVERANEDIIELTSGCLCCTMRGDLVDTLTTLLDKISNGEIQQLRHIIIETTGLADPAPIVQLFLSHPLLIPSFALSGVITTIDAKHGLATLDQFEEAHKQVIFADQLVLTKVDLVSEQKQHANLLQNLRLDNKNAEIIESRRFTAQDVIACDIFNRSNKDADLPRWLTLEENDTQTNYAADHQHATSDNAIDEISLRHGHHKNFVQTFALTYHQPTKLAAVEGFIDALAAQFGNNILRVKGIVAIREDIDRPLIIHGVQGHYHPPVQLCGWPDNQLQTRLVFITTKIERAKVENLLRAFFNVPTIDTPDCQAILDNPLAIPGLKF